MATESFSIFPTEDTTIDCNTPDGKVIAVDAMDLDEMLIQVYIDNNADTLPQSVYLGAMCKKFHATYGFNIGKWSMYLLLQKKQEMLNVLKKNTYPELEPASSTESPPIPSSV